MGRVLPYGFGKTFITIRMDELPKDIQDGLIERFKTREDDKRIDVDSIELVMCCEEIFSKSKKEK